MNIEDELATGRMAVPNTLELAQILKDGECRASVGRYLAAREIERGPVTSNDPWERLKAGQYS